MKNIFSIFNVSTNSFEGKHPDEKVLLCTHRHWYTLIAAFAYAFLGALLPFVLIVLFGPIIVQYHLSKIVVFLFTSYYMIVWYMLGYAITMYVMDIWIVTDQRIIDSTQQGFFNRTVSEISLGNIQDVSTMVTGMIPTTMNFGDVEVQSAGKVEHFRFHQVPRPQEIKDIISEALAEYKHTHFKDEALEVARDIEEAKDRLGHTEVIPPESLTK